MLEGYAVLTLLLGASCCWRHEIFRVQATKIPYSAGKPLPPAGHLLGSKLSSLDLFPLPSALHDLQPVSEPLQDSKPAHSVPIAARILLVVLSSRLPFQSHVSLSPECPPPSPYDSTSRHPNDMTRLPSPHNTMPQRIPDHRLHT
jgi:hypothetical protein